MTEYINMWKNAVNFSDRTSLRGYWMSYLINVCISLALGIFTAVTGLAILSSIYGLLIIVPSLAITVRRLRDADKHWAWIFINLIPVIGIIIFIVMLAKPSKEYDGVPVV